MSSRRNERYTPSAGRLPPLPETSPTPSMSAVLAGASSAAAIIARTTAPRPYYDASTIEPVKSVGYAIKRCGLLFSQWVEQRFLLQGISFMQWLILAQLRFRSNISVTQLSEQLEYDIGALSRAVDTLERGGLLRRVRSRHDRRGVELSLTLAGREHMESGRKRMAELLNQLTQPFSHKEIEQLLLLLRRTLARIQVLIRDEAHSQKIAAEKGGAKERLDRSKSDPGGKT